MYVEHQKKNLLETGWFSLFNMLRMVTGTRVEFASAAPTDVAEFVETVSDTHIRQIRQAHCRVLAVQMLKVVQLLM